MLPTIPFPLDIATLILVAALAAGVAAVPRARTPLLVLVASAGALSLWDQTRWQPWFYQYFLILAILGICTGKERGDERRRVALNSCQLLVAFTYLWGGVQKLNVAFIEQTWPDIAGPFFQRCLAGTANRVPQFLGVLIPVAEVCIGAGLIARRFRDASVLAAIASHAVILLLLVSSQENAVVWPWNIAMGLFVAILFWHDKQTSALRIVAPTHALQLFLLLLVGVLPALSFAGLWDSYLSWALYSGNTRQAAILLSPQMVDRLPAALRPYIWQTSKPFFLDINRWAYGELNVPAYPEPRIYKSVAKQVCRDAGGSSEIKLMIRTRPDPLTGHRDSEYFDCDHL